MFPRECEHAGHITCCALSNHPALVDKDNQYDRYVSVEIESDCNAHMRPAW